MNWTITIEASGENADEMSATITAVMQVNADGVPQIVELIVRGSEGGEIPARATRDIDFEMLARALSGAVATTSNHPETAPRKTSAKAARAGKTDERPYRKMPDADEVKEVFLRTESVGKLALHYAVPRYTAQAWVDRLRRTGYLEGRSTAPSALSR